MARRLGGIRLSRIVISSEARNLPCRPTNDAYVNAKIRSNKASFPCQCLCDTDRSARETLIQSKNQCFPKRRGVLIALRAVVISSVAERSFLHCGQYHIGTAGKRRLGAAHILCLSVCKEDFSLALEMTIRESSSH